MKTEALETVVREYLIEGGDTTEHRLARMLRIAFSGMRELHMDISGSPKSVLLDINANATVDLPDDFISYVKIGLCGENGNIHALGWNPQMCMLRNYDDCGDEIGATAQATDDGVVFAGYDGDYQRNGELTGRLFGLGGGNNANGYYRVDKENKYLLLQDVTASQIWLEYLASYEQMTGEHQVNEFEIEALKAWMFWSEIKRNRTYSEAKIAGARTEWRRRRKEAMRRFRGFTISEALQSIRRTNQTTVKF